MKMEKKLVYKYIKPSEILNFLNEIDHEYTSIDDHRNLDNLLFRLLDNNSEVMVMFNPDDNKNFHITQDFKYENGYGERIGLSFEQFNKFDSCFVVSHFVLLPNEKIYTPVSRVKLISSYGDFKTFSAEITNVNNPDSRYICEGGKFGGMLTSIKSNDMENQETSARIDDFITEMPEIIANTVGSKRQVTGNFEYFDELLLRYNTETKKR